MGCLCSRIDYQIQQDSFVTDPYVYTTETELDMEHDKFFTQYFSWRSSWTTDPLEINFENCVLRQKAVVHGRYGKKSYLNGTVCHKVVYRHLDGATIFVLYITENSDPVCWLPKPLQS